MNMKKTAISATGHRRELFGALEMKMKYSTKIPTTIKNRKQN